jgi:glucan phosphoethanolaminetransferase (alkaline phosphatase superfamily)
MRDIEKCNKINVVGLEILKILVPLKIFLGEIFFRRIFGCFLKFFLFLCSIGLSYFLTFFLIIIISDWLKLLHESKEENAIYFVFLEMCKQKFEVTEFEFPAFK